MEQITRGRTPQEDYDNLILMLDTVFFTDDKEQPQREFLELLPKLYKQQYDPCHNNFIVKEGETLCAAVGSYYSTVHVGGETLRMNGIGNVAVTRACRSKGYMKDCMQQALEDMKATGTDLSDLGGQRQRYGYFGYEPAGVELSFRVGKTNVRHCCGADAKSALTVRKLTAADAALFPQIDALYRSVAPYTERAMEAYFDILCSWRAVPYAVFDGAEFAGYFVLNRNADHVSELRAAKKEDTQRLVLAAMETAQKDLSLDCSLFDTALRDALLLLSEGYEVCHVHQYNVLCYANVIRAFLKEKALHEPLCNGEVVLLIHGWTTDEQLKIRVENNAVTVEETELSPCMELEHLDAMRLLFSLHSPLRMQLAPEAAQWLPIPLFGYSADAV